MKNKKIKNRWLEDKILVHRSVEGECIENVKLRYDLRNVSKLLRVGDNLKSICLSDYLTYAPIIDQELISELVCLKIYPLL